MVHSGYHSFSIVLLGWYLDGTQWISFSKHHPLRLVLGWCTVDIILLSIVLLDLYLDGAQWILSPLALSS